ncbi:hypothetical protein CKO51_01075 [Rhodopirellula sp. SM50]|nr:DUF4129 domain-containing protein [Rhodopirellula sp. SM50]PAY21452.1 hypothetical protein CKO51_01075 [Rhodopirellula sp. SM50]
MASRPQPADYAAIGVGPVLIFLMISSLANFFVSLLYDGNFSDRVFYLILMYTMGSVALARMVIEESRAYSAGYAMALGAAMVFVMTGFVGSMFFSIGLVVLIGYLADRIVHDCTVIDESVDASGEGLIDRGLDEASGLSRRIAADNPGEQAPASEKERRRRKSHQPGRTVFLLALAALPLFGIGQFMLQNSPQVWARAQLMLGLYLFSSLSLLVTTSFLNLRRYLRQRDVDMPGDVTVAWLAGGVALIAALLMLAFLAPMPGAAIAKFELPKFLKTDPKTASSAGWGKEAAEKSDTPSDAETNRDRAPSQKDQKGAGVNQNRASGKSDGKKSGQQQSGQQQSGQQQSGQQQSGQQQSGQQQSGQQQSGQQQSGQQQSSESEAQNQSRSAESTDRGNQQSESAASEPAGKQEHPSEDPQRDGQTESEESESAAERGDSAETSSASSSSSMPSLPDVLPAVSGLFRLLLILGLLAIVAFYLYQMRERLALWWQSLFGRERDAAGLADAIGPEKLRDAPRRPFASFRNPIGHETDPRRVVVMTCQAFEAWSRERGFERNRDETFSEFGLRLRQATKQRHDARALFAPVEPATGRLTAAYDRIVYGRGQARQGDLDAAKVLWKHMSGAPVHEMAGA